MQSRDHGYITEVSWWESLMAAKEQENQDLLGCRKIPKSNWKEDSLHCGDKKALVNLYASGLLWDHSQR